MKKWSQVIRRAAPVTQNYLSKPEDLMLQNATLLRKSGPDLLTCLMEMSLVLRLPREIHLCRLSSNTPCPPLFILDTMQNPLHLPRSATLQRAKVIRTFDALCSLNSKCASRRNSEHFWSSQLLKAQNLRRFCTFWLPRVVRVTAARTLPTSPVPKAFRRSRGLTPLTSKSGSAPHRRAVVHISS